MMRPEDEKTIAMEKAFCFSVPESRGMPHQAGPTQGSTRVSEEAEGATWNMGKGFVGISTRMNVWGIGNMVRIA